MMVYFCIVYNLVVQADKHLSNVPLNIKRHVWNFIPHYRAFIATRHFRAFCRGSGIIEKAIIRKQVIEKRRITPFFCSHNQHII